MLIVNYVYPGYFCCLVKIFLEKDDKKEEDMLPDVKRHMVLFFFFVIFFRDFVWLMIFDFLVSHRKANVWVSYNIMLPLCRWNKDCHIGYFIFKSYFLGFFFFWFWVLVSIPRYLFVGGIVLLMDPPCIKNTFKRELKVLKKLIYRLQELPYRYIITQRLRVRPTQRKFFFKMFVLYYFLVLFLSTSLYENPDIMEWPLNYYLDEYEKIYVYPLPEDMEAVYSDDE